MSSGAMANLRRSGRRLRNAEGGDVTIYRKMFVENDQGGGQQSLVEIDTDTTVISSRRAGQQSLNVGDEELERVEYVCYLNHDTDVQRDDVLEDANGKRYTVIHARGSSPQAETICLMKDFEDEI